MILTILVVLYFAGLITTILVDPSNLKRNA